MIVIFPLMIQGWEDIMKLSTDFPEMFSNLPNDILLHTDSWKEVG
jgi:hypothetical protein